MMSSLPARSIRNTRPGRFPLWRYQLGVSRNACVWPVALVPLATIWPLSLIAVASLRVNPEPGGIRLLRFWNVPLLQIQAPLPDWPTITPWLLIASPTGSSPKVPRSIILPPLHKNTSVASLAVCAQPVTWPRLLIAYAALWVPPSVPRSVIAPLAHSTACELPLALSEAPTTWWLLLIPLALLKVPPP